MAEADNYGGDLAYDLRQRYAKLVADHIEDISMYRKERNYPEWFRALEDLYTITEYKFKINKEEKKEKDKLKINEKAKFEFQVYTNLKKELIDISNEHPNTWGGSTNISEEIAKIETALRNIEEWLYYKMNEVNMFGSKREAEGLA